MHAPAEGAPEQPACNRKRLPTEVRAEGLVTCYCSVCSPEMGAKMMNKDQYLENLVLKLTTSTPLPPEERTKLLRLPLTLKYFESGHDIVREGEQTKQCCLVCEGLVCRYKIIGEGGRQILSLHLPGDIPDVHSLLIDRMDHSLGTLTPAVVGFIAHDAVRALTRSSYRISEAFWRETLIEASIYREWMAGIGRRSAPSRIAHLLCEFITKMTAIGLSNGVTCVLPLTQPEIADALGLSTVHMNKKLAEIRKAGLVRIRANRLTILDWKGLCDVADFDPNYLHLRPSISPK